MENKVCPKCQGEMENGYIFDRGHFNKMNTQIWRVHKPGIWENSWGNIKNASDIFSYRCKSCGFLESYAK